jgi:branched-chain amino acid transport system ATP-binding protein
MHVDEGELVGLIGPNGAGKTTVFNLLTGVYAPSEGGIRFDGHTLNGLRPHQVAHCGIARTFQNVRLFKTLTALQNVKVAAHMRSRRALLSAVLRAPLQCKEDSEVEKECLELLERLDLRGYSQERSDSLPYGLQRRLEVARALATRPRLLLLDEPGAGMNPNEKSELMALIQRIRSDFRLTVLLIEHDMRLVMGICERIYVLDYGQIICEGDPAAISSDPRVIAAYLGTGVD